MTKLKNGLWIDFKWDDKMGLPLVYIADREDQGGYLLTFNLKAMSLEAAVKQARELIPENIQQTNY